MIKNIPVGQICSLSDLIGQKGNQIISKAILSGGIVTTLLSFPKGELVSEEAYSGDTVYFIVEGMAKIHTEERDYSVKKGDILRIAAGKLHSIGGEAAFKVLQINSV